MPATSAGMTMGRCSHRNALWMGGPAVLFPQLGQYLYDLLIAVHDLAEEAFAVNVAILVERRFHQDAGLVLRRDGHAVQGLPNHLSAALPTFSPHVLSQLNPTLPLAPL